MLERGLGRAEALSRVT